MATDWPAFTPETLADVLQSHVDATYQFLERLREGPATSSILTRARSDPALHDAYDQASMHLVGGLDHMWALVLELRGKPLPLFAGYTLNRAELEAAARAYWLLEEGLGEGTRVARALVSRVDSLWNQSRLVPATDAKAGAMSAFLEERLQQVRADAAKHHLSVRDFKDGHQREGQPSSIGKTTYPGPTRAVDILLEWAFEKGGTRKWFYAFLSGFAHSTTYAMVLRSQVVEDHADGFKTIEPRIDMASLSAATIACAYAHSRALRLLGDAAGCSNAPSIELPRGRP